MSELETISAVLAVKLKPWPAPRFAIRADASMNEDASIPVKDFDEAALEDMALAWVRDLYRQAGREDTFRWPTKAVHP